jgi:hypothetical protein
MFSERGYVVLKCVGNTTTRQAEGTLSVVRMLVSAGSTSKTKDRYEQVRMRG